MDLDATVRDLARRLVGYCLLRTNDRGLAEEIAQESLAALVHRWRRHGTPKSPDAFVFAIARRRAARALLRRRLWLPLEGARRVGDQTPNAEARLVRRSERDRIVTALSHLSRADRDVLLLLVVGEVSLGAAASMLGISVPAVKMRAHRARRRLRELLEDSGAADKRR